MAKSKPVPPDDPNLPEVITNGKPPHRQGPGTYHDPILKTGRFKTNANGKKPTLKLADGRSPDSGRPTVLTQELASHLGTLVAEGCPAEIVRAAVGVSTFTWNRWKNLAEQGDDLAVELFEVMEQAEGIGNYGWLQKWQQLTDQGNKNWVSAATYLERRLPDLFARPDRWRGEGSTAPVSAANALEDASRIVYDTKTLQLTINVEGTPVPPDQETEEEGEGNEVL